MTTFSASAVKANCIIEQVHLNTLSDTMKKWKGALAHYYTQGYDNGDTTKLYNELIKLGANPDELFDIDFEIRDSIETYRNSLFN